MFLKPTLIWRYSAIRVSPVTVNWVAERDLALPTGRQDRQVFPATGALRSVHLFVI